MDELSFGSDGAQRFRGALSRETLAELAAALSHLPQDVAGIRLTAVEGVRPLLTADGPVGRIAREVLQADAFPVRALLFDKNSAANWGLAWHQDRTVVVRERAETEGYGPWSVKSGLIHVSPPFRVLEGMATLRVHLDDVDADNAPLLIAAGSHRLGRIEEGSVSGVVQELGTTICMAEAADVWAYSTPILHASKPALRPSRRRVLQVDFAYRPLDGKLEWLGV